MWQASQYNIYKEGKAEIVRKNNNSMNALKIITK